ncbi:hypothetical protein V5F53_20245 [Xanthobacter sp. V4C-4]|uniref:bestrophin-like domain n=1 Tax=Xanthobacter cornucopiae TaxID=3119924 RepID=UPI00372C187B
MTSWMVAPLACAAMLAGAFLAMVVARRSPADYLSDDTRYTLKLTVGLTAAMTSLILGLMTTSMRYTYSAAGQDVQEYAVTLLTADMELRQLGPQACPARHALATYARLVLDETWGGSPGGIESAPTPTRFEAASARQLLRLEEMVRALSPASDDQKLARADAARSLKALLTHRWKLSSDADSRIPTLFVLVVMGWLTLIFAGFGWFAPRNPPALVALSLSSLAIAAALFLVVEMGEPFAGPMRIAPAPILDTLDAMASHPCGAA